MPNELVRLYFGSEADPRTPIVGSYDLFVGPEDAMGLAWNDDASVVQAALEGLANVGSGNVTVTPITTVGFEIEFVGDLAKQDVVAMTVSPGGALEDEGGQIGMEVVTVQDGYGPPVAPSDLTASGIGDTYLHLDWTDNADNEDGYRVLSRLAGSGDYTILGFGDLAADTESADPYDLNPATAYDFQVFAFRGDEVSDPAELLNVSTAGGGGGGVGNPMMLFPGLGMGL